MLVIWDVKTPFDGITRESIENKGAGGDRSRKSRAGSENVPRSLTGLRKAQNPLPKILYCRDNPRNY